jgi:hypothetical protein
LVIHAIKSFIRSALIETLYFAAKLITAEAIVATLLISDAALKVGKQIACLGETIWPHRHYNAKALFSGQLIHSVTRCNEFRSILMPN